MRHRNSAQQGVLLCGCGQQSTSNHTNVHGRRQISEAASLLQWYESQWCWSMCRPSTPDELVAGERLNLSAAEPHAAEAIEDSSVLVTIL